MLFRELHSKAISSRVVPCSWDKPILLAWGMLDKYLPLSIAEEFQKKNPSNIELKVIEGAGHMPQEDW